MASPAEGPFDLVAPNSKSPKICMVGVDGYGADGNLNDPPYNGHLQQTRLSPGNNQT